MNPWWLGLDPAQATISCGEDAHRLRWEKGELQALDHEDPEGERALAALGGHRCACVEVLDAWSRHDGDPRVLVLASRGPADPLGAHTEWTAQLGALPALAAPAPVQPTVAAPRRQLFRRPARRRATAVAPGHGWASYALAPAPGGVPLGNRAETELIALLGLGGGVQDRLIATVASAWAQRSEQGDPALGAARPLLQATMHGRLCAVIRTWLGHVDVDVELEVIDARGTPTLTDDAGVVRAELPFAWLADVWSRGLATVMGRFCLAASTADGRTWRLTTVAPDLGSPLPVTIELEV